MNYEEASDNKYIVSNSKGRVQSYVIFSKYEERFIFIVIHVYWIQIISIDSKYIISDSVDNTIEYGISKTWRKAVLKFMLL